MTIEDRTLTQWLEDPDPVRAVRFAGPGESWETWSYADLAALSMRTAAALTARGLGPGDVLALIRRSSPGFVATYFGALAAGLTVSSIAPPFAFQREDEYAQRAGGLLAVVRPALIVTDTESMAHVGPTAAALGLADPIVFEDLVEGAEPAALIAPPAELAMIQFTSGSSGNSRGVRVPTSALAANVNGMRRWLGWTPDVSGVTWLPVHHDMGLIGCLISVVVSQCDAWIMQPDDFIRSPQRYLRTIAENDARITAMPNFGLAYILRRVRPAQLEGLDFSGVTGIILGAERNDPRVLDSFHQLLEPFGLRRSALLPAYGGAEATLAVTGLPMGEGWSAAAPVGADGEPVGEAQIVGCGRPLDGVKVEVVDDDGLVLPDGRIGEILVTGASVAADYEGDGGTASGTRLAGGTLHSGDAGFMKDGQLFVLGRLGDGLKVRGAMVFAESLEARIAERGLPERRCAVLLGVLDGEPTGVAVMETPKPEWAGIVADVLREALDGARLHAVTVPRGGLAVTSSGKPRRRVMWKEFCAGTLVGATEPLPAG